MTPKTTTFLPFAKASSKIGKKNILLKKNKA